MNQTGVYVNMPLKRLERTRKAYEDDLTINPPKPKVEPSPKTCKVCGGYGFVAQKQFIDDGFGEVDTCKYCEETK